MERQCAEYFKINKGFKRLIEGIREKYRSLGYVGGTVTLNNLTPQEKDALSGFMKKDYYSKKSAAIKVEKFLLALESTRFSGVDFEEVLREYFGEDLLSKREERETYEAERENFFNGIIAPHEGTAAGAWLKSVLKGKQNPYKMVTQAYDTSRERLRETLLLTLRGLNELTFKKEKPVRLALFSSNISKNPHTFDPGTDCGKLLLYGICHILGIEYPKNAEERAEALYGAGIITDEVSNFTMLSGLLAYSSGVLHQGFEGFYNLSEPLQVSLWNLSSIDRIESPSKKVFVLENPTVFSELLQGLEDIKPPLVCTCGQIKLASLILLDKLAEANHQIYYAGDFDPEGILIADRLKERYGERLILWRYTEEDYKAAISESIIEKTRLKKLEKVKSPELNAIAEHIRKEGKCGYQEMLVKEYICDIRRLQIGLPR